MGQLGLYVLVGGVAAVTAWLLTPAWVALARRLGVMEKVDPGKIHIVPIPTMGGVAMYAAFMVALLFASRLEAFRPQFVFSSEWLGIALGATLMTIIGAVDDLKGLTPPAKLAAQVFAAAVMTIPGVQVFSFWLPWVNSSVSLSPDLAIPLTIMIVIATANAVNLVDGLDGLAAGLVAIGALGYFVFSYRTGSAGLFIGETPAPLISIITVGVCLGFLPHNFNPAKVFMGDTGALFLGTLLSSATITGIGRTTEPRFADGVALVIPIALPALVMALPFLDVALSIVRRVRSGHGWMRRDKAHLHHRLMALGHSHRNAVLLLWMWSAVLAATTVALSVTGPRRVLPISALAVAVGAVLLVYPNRGRLATLANGRGAVAAASHRRAAANRGHDSGHDSDRDSDRAGGGSHGSADGADADGVDGADADGGDHPTTDGDRHDGAAEQAPAAPAPAARNPAPRTPAPRPPRPPHGPDAR